MLLGDSEENSWTVVAMHEVLIMVAINEEG